MDHLKTAHFIRLRMGVIMITFMKCKRYHKIETPKMKTA